MTCDLLLGNIQSIDHIEQITSHKSMAINFALLVAEITQKCMKIYKIQATKTLCTFQNAF